MTSTVRDAFLVCNSFADLCKRRFLANFERIIVNVECEQRWNMCPTIIRSLFHHDFMRARHNAVTLSSQMVLFLPPCETVFTGDLIKTDIGFVFIPSKLLIKRCVLA